MYVRKLICRLEWMWVARKFQIGYEGDGQRQIVFRLVDVSRLRQQPKLLMIGNITYSMRDIFAAPKVRLLGRDLQTIQQWAVRVVVVCYRVLDACSRYVLVPAACGSASKIDSNKLLHDQCRSRLIRLADFVISSGVQRRRPGNQGPAA